MWGPCGSVGRVEGKGWQGEAKTRGNGVGASLILPGWCGGFGE
jgi:hypothetical protein